MNLRRLIIWSIIGTGISSITTQLLTIREFLTQFHGNEITISLVLFSWLLLTGLGSLAAKPFERFPLGVYALLTCIIALWPLAQLVVIREFRDALFIHGASPGFYPIFFYIIITVSPYCLLTGFILPCAQKTLNTRHFTFGSGDLYLTDSIGDITGGVLFSYVLVYWVKPFPAIALTSTVLILVSLLLLLKSRNYILFLIAILFGSFFYYYSTNNRFEKHTLAGQYGNVVRYLESPYGRIVVSKKGNEHTFWESGTPFYSDLNIISSEERIHYALCQMDRVQNVLLVSGGLGDSLTEALKYNPAYIDYVELDPYLTDTALQLNVLKKAPCLEIVNTDGRRYIETTEKRYDAIIVGLPDPDTFQINRFFTSEFFSHAKNALKTGGILSISIEYAPNYISKIRKMKISTIYNTARLHFKNVMVLPGEEAYFLCRDGPLWSDIPARLKLKSISTSYIEGFFYGNVTKERIRQLKGNLDRNEFINTDFEPRLMNLVLKEWFTKYGTSTKYFLFGLAAFTLIYLIFIKREEYVLFSTGLATMGVEMLIIFTFQVIYGYIYLKIGAIVTCFLLGLLPGAIIGNIRGYKDKANLALSEMLILFMLFLFFMWTAHYRNELHPMYFLVYCFLFSFLCGFQFPVVAGLIGEKRSPAAGCFSADLCGASVGTFIVGTILIPLWGIQFAIIFLIMVKVSSSIIILFFTKTRSLV